MRKIAVTGGLAAGKSTVCSFFSECGASVVSADKIVYKLIDSNQNVRKQLLAFLGSDVMTDDRLDRKKIADKVFGDKDLLKQLEEIVHPYVADEIAQEYDAAKRAGTSPLFVAEVPLLFEAGLESDYDTVVVVVSHVRDRTIKYATERMERQMDITEKAALADHVIENDGTLEELKQKVVSLFDQLKG